MKVNNYILILKIKEHEAEYSDLLRHSVACQN